MMFYIMPHNDFVYIVYTLGPITDRCGTPCHSHTDSDFTPRITTDWVLSPKYDSNHVCGLSLIPNSLLNLLSRVV